MDITLYFNPVDFGLPDQEEKFSRDTLGYTILKESRKADRTRKGEIKVALIGVPYESEPGNAGVARAPGEIRKHLYRLSCPEGFHGIVDLGDLKPGKNRKDLFFALRDIVEYLNDKDVVPVILGGGQDISIGIAASFREDKRFVLTIVDSRVDIKSGREATGPSNFISRILLDQPQLFHLQVIGVQNHLLPVSVQEKLRSQTFDCIRLGPIRDDFNALEPALRNTTFLSFDMSSVRQADGGGCLHTNPNGFHGEEACRIAHYTGLSNKIKAFGLFELNPEFDDRGKTANLCAQMIWYFLDALNHRFCEDPLTDPSAFVKYYVDLEGDPLVFYNHRASGRWWLEIGSGEHENYLIPCGEKDYTVASGKEIPDIWWKFARKTDRLSK